MVLGIGLNVKLDLSVRFCDLNGLRLRLRSSKRRTVEVAYVFNNPSLRQNTEKIFDHAADRRKTIPAAQPINDNRISCVNRLSAHDLHCYY